MFLKFPTEKESRWKEKLTWRTLHPKDLFAYGKLPLVDFHIGILD